MVQNFLSIDVVTVCATGEEALNTLSTTRIDLVLADLRMHPVDGIELLRSVRKHALSTKVIVFSSYELEEDIYQALNEGAWAYINKYASGEELLNTIHRVHSGERVFSKRIQEKFDERRTRKDRTTGEFQILEMMHILFEWFWSFLRSDGSSVGNCNRDIAAELYITEETVESHWKHIIETLQANDSTQTLALELRCGLIQL